MNNERMTLADWCARMFTLQQRAKDALPPHYGVYHERYEDEITDAEHDVMRACRRLNKLAIEAGINKKDTP